MATNNTDYNIEEGKKEVHHEPTIYAEPILEVGNFTITNALLTSWLAVVVIIVLSIAIRLSLKKIPGKFQHIIEIFFGGALKLCDQITNDRKITNKIFPIILTVFVFILINNWVGILPIIGSIGFFVTEAGYEHFVPIFRGGTADINTTLALGVLAVVGSNIFGVIILGFWKSFNKYVKLKELGKIFTNFRKDPSIIVIAPISFFVGLIEIIGEMAKIASLSFRLFGNIFAGEVLLASMAAILVYVLPGPFIFLEIFIGFIQALIFALLTTVYFTIAAQDHDDHHEEHSHSEHTEELAKV